MLLGSSNEDGGKPPRHVYADLNFLVRDSLYDVEKPYSMRYPPEGDLKQRNLKSERKRVKITDYRDCCSQLDFDECGFEIATMQTAMSYDDFDDETKLASVYAVELGNLLKRRLGAKHVYLIDYALRKRDASFPISTGKDFGHDQPTSSTHIDFTRAEGERYIRALYPDCAEQIMGAHWQIINVWKPVKYQVRDWPLAICDATSFNNQEDAVAADIVYPNWVTENMQVHYSADQQWYYASNQEVDECWVFKSVDSHAEVGGQCPHTAFSDPHTRIGDPLRESIDVRALVMYADLDPFPMETHNNNHKPDYRDGIS